MELIISKDNTKIKYVKKLIASSSFRKEEGLFVAEGKRLCDDALRSGAGVALALFSEDFCQNHPDDLERFRHSADQSFLVRNSIFCALSDTKTPQGVLFVIKTLDKPIDFDKMNKNGKIAALESIKDPSNLGTILRSAEAFGVDLVVLSDDCCDIYSPKVIRGSMGALFRQAVCIVDDLPAFIERFNHNGTSYAAVLDRDSVSLSEICFSSPSLVCIGNEGRGLSERVISSCSEKVFIPMLGDAESLNASVAASILMWEMIK
ncbi:MAG: RNA methyltransferase [Ruminococcus sp.]|nr:RNA methyltransferase [Ruminococcus sp.]MBQ6153459.1 RNA methyltransferase [Ruminococcus sp.]